MKKLCLFFCFFFSYFLNAQGPGSLDLSFDAGSGGVYTPSPSNVSIYHQALQSDGKIIVVGYFDSFSGTSRSRITRLNSDGTTDTTFNPGIGAGGNSSIRSVLVQSDGKIVIVGFFSTFNGVARKNIARLNSNGSLDSTFNPGAGANDFINEAVLQSDGKIIIAGDFFKYNNVDRPGLARVNADGSLDTTFVPGTGPNGMVTALLVLPTGKILIGGNFHTYNGVNRENLARINSNGSLDSSFIPPMVFNSTFAGIVSDIKLQFGNKIVICGDFRAYSNTTSSRIARMDLNGTIDSSFYTANTAYDANGNINTLAIQADNKIIIGGQFTTFNGVSRYRFARLNSAGSLDLTFNVGTGVTSTKTIYNNVSDIILQPDGKAVIIGNFTHYNNIARNEIARIIGGEPAAIDAIDDEGTINGSVGGDVLNVLANDLVAGLQATTSNVTITKGVASHVNITINTSTGDINIASGTPQGIYTISYKICNSSNVCDTATVTINVPRTIKAVDDIGATVYTGIGGVVVESIFLNDTVGNGLANPITNVNYSQISPSIPGISISAAGKVTVSNAVAAGPYIITYSICDKQYPTLNCDTAKIRIIVLSDKITATPDEFALTTNGGLTGSVILNDIRYGLPLTSNNVSLSILNNGGLTGISFNSSQLNVPPSAVGIYNLTYQVCLVSNPTICATANVTIYINNFNPGNQPADIYSSLYLPNGKILLGGVFPKNLKRLNSDLSFDATFNTSGIGAEGTVLAIARQADGKILIGGSFSFYNGVVRRYIARIFEDGTLDTSFNAVLDNAVNYRVQDIEIQADGKIIIAGLFNNVNGVARRMIARLNSDGTLDPTFSVTGLNAIGVMNDVVILANGQIIVGGNYDISGRRHLQKFNSNGVLDTTFNSALITSGTGNAIVNALALQTDGKIIVGGEFDYYYSDARQNIVRINSNGTIDSPFNSQGFGIGNSSVNTITLIDYSSILIGGDFNKYGVMDINNVAILTSYGDIDSSENPGSGANNIVRTSCIQPDKKIIIGGTFSLYNETPRAGVTRLLPWIPGYEGRTTGGLNVDSKEIYVYPNPNNGIFTVDFGMYNDQKIDLEVYNGLGQLVYKKKLYSNDENVINLSNLQKGVYNVMLINNEKVINKQIIIN